MNSSSRTERWGVWMLMTLTAAIYVGSAGIPALLDDADSFYAEVAREMNQHHDWITPYANTLRYLEKPPLFYWLIQISYKLFGAMNAFTARLPTALAVTALVFVTYKIGSLLFGFRAGLFGGLALATSVGMFLFTRIILPDALFTLVLSLLIYCFVRWERTEQKTGPLLWMYVFAGIAVMAKGLIGIVFPVGIIVLTLSATGRWKEIARLVSFKGMLIFLAIAAPWHILIGWRNPGFFWFYFINEHLLRFLGKRYPMDYNTVPLVPFWLLHAVWLFPWSVWLLTLCWPPNLRRALAERRQAVVLLAAWALTILAFFSFSSRLEYYTLPAFPALALLAGAQFESFQERGARWPGIALACGVGLLTGITLIVLAVFITSHNGGSFLHLKDNPELYTFYLGHLFDLTPESLSALRAPLLMAGLGVGVLLPLHHWFKRPETKAFVLSLGMAVFFAAASLALVAFAPRLTSQPLAAEVNRRFTDRSVIVIDGEYSEGCSLAFYARRTVLLHNGRATTLEYGSRYPDAPPLFLDDAGLQKLWRDPAQRVFLLTFQAKQDKLNALIPESKFTLASYGDKLLLSNRSDQEQDSNHANR
ncbi:MAG: ArnT family glycosyltransferase [Blastocatellales bacterium]